MESGRALQRLAVTVCYLTTLTSAIPIPLTEPTKPSPPGDSTHSYPGRNLFVHPYYKTSTQPSGTTRQHAHGHDPGVSEPRPFPPPPPPPRRFRPGPRLRRPSLAKAFHQPFHVYSADAGDLAPRQQDTPSAPDSKTSQDKDHGKTGIDTSSWEARGHQNASTLLPTGAEQHVNTTLATNGTAAGDQENSPTATVLSASTIWTLVLCAAMIVAAVAFFAVVLAVCRCRQRRERRKKYLTTQKNIRVMQNMVKMAARKKKETTRQGPFGRISDA